MTHVNNANIIEIDLADRISAAFTGVFANMKRARLARKTIRELSALSTRELDDLGIHRSMIKSIAIEAAYNN